MGGENEINANSAFKYVGVEVEAELGKNIMFVFAAGSKIVLVTVG